MSVSFWTSTAALPSFLSEILRPAGEALMLGSISVLERFNRTQSATPALHRRHAGATPALTNQTPRAGVQLRPQTAAGLRSQKHKRPKEVGMKASSAPPKGRAGAPSGAELQPGGGRGIYPFPFPFLVSFFLFFSRTSKPNQFGRAFGTVCLDPLRGRRTPPPAPLPPSQEVHQIKPRTRRHMTAAVGFSSLLAATVGG